MYYIKYFGLTTDPESVPEKFKHNTCKLECKNNDLPNLNMDFDQLFDLDSLCAQMKQELESYVGKVIILW